MVLTGYALILFGWLVAVVLGHGFELHRMALVSAGLVPGAVLVVIGSSGGRPLWGPGIWVVASAAIYLVLRAFLSPIWDLARLDLILVLAFVICFVASGRVLQNERGRLMLLGALVAVFAGHLLTGLYQQFSDPAFAVFRPERTDRSGASGLFWHRNYLAGMLSLMLPVWLALAILSWWTPRRLGFAVLLVVGLILAFLTKSRAGFLAVAAGLAVVVTVVLYRRSMAWKPQARVALLTVMVVLGVGALGAGAVVVSKISEDRGKGADLEEALVRDVRLALSGLAFEQWMESPLIGTGGRTYSYKAIEYWDPGNLYVLMGNPVMVHNDYLQALAEYGALGLLGLMGAALMLGGSMMLERRHKNDANEDPSLIAIQIGSLGALAAAMCHSIFDFPLHILPCAMLLGLLSGSLVVGRTARNGRTGRSRGSGFVSAVLLIGAAGALGAVTWREVASAGRWYQLERRIVSGEASLDQEGARVMRSLLASAPEHRLARSYGGGLLRLYQQNPEGNGEILFEALRALRIAVERHPFDGESLINYAMALSYRGEVEQAAAYFGRAVEATWRREIRYGAMYRFSAHLWGWGEREWLARRPEKALGLFMRSQEYFERAWEARAAGLTWANYKELSAERNERIEFLEGAGIAPEFHDEVPVPPGGE